MKITDATDEGNFGLFSVDFVLADEERDWNEMACEWSDWLLGLRCYGTSAAVDLLRWI